MWGSPGLGDGMFNHPTGVAVDNLGYIYVADMGNNRIQKFSSTGAYVRKWGTEGSGNGQFNYPYSVAVDGSRNVYVADYNNDRVQKFTSTGVYVTQWGSHGSGNGQFDYPYGVAVDGSENVYVTDYNNDRVQKFTSTGVYVTKWGTEGSGNGQFNSPRGVTVDGSGNVYVTDAYSRIQKFTSTGVYVTKWGKQGSGNGQFISPRSVAVYETGNVYVADSTNNRIQIFNIAPGIPLGEAVDINLKWTTSGSKTWFGQTAISNYDGDAARTRSLIDDQYAYIQTSVIGPGNLSFYWKVSSELDWDRLEFNIDSTLQKGISGEVDWLQEIYQIDSGSHTLEWRYTKNSDTSRGMDAGWLDHIQYTPLNPAFITVTSPDGKENWIRGAAHEIMWMYTGSPGSYVQIELLKAGVVNKVITTSTANDGSYDWTIPSTQALGADYRIRITSTAYPDVTDSSNANFEITPGSLTVTSPNGRETWPRDTGHTITWTKSGSLGNYVKIELLKADVVNQILVASTTNSGSYSWTIPSSQALGADYSIRITSTTYPDVTDSSNANFVITPGSLTVTSLNGGETFLKDTAHTITWTKSGSTGDSVLIELLKAGVVNRVITASTANDGSYDWTILSAQALGADYRIRITSTTYPEVTDSSNTNFEITAIEEMTVNSPNGGESWVGGTTHEITWTSTGSSKVYVKIELLKNGVLNTVISSSTTNDGSFLWKMPLTLTLGVDYRVRITRTTLSLGLTTPASDTSNGNFAIIAEQLTVTSPNGGETWVNGFTKKITWTSTGSPTAAVRIELVKPGALNRLITSSTPNDGSFDWVIPMTISLGTDYTVKITRTTYPTGGTAATDSSNGYFSLIPETLTVNSPNGGESWVSGTAHTVTWAYSGSPTAFVKIELVKPGVANKIISASTLNDGSYDWVVPVAQPLGSDYTIKITRTTFPVGSFAATDTSNTAFSILH